MINITLLGFPDAITLSRTLYQGTWQVKEEKAIFDTMHLSRYRMLNLSGVHRCRTD